MSPARETPVTLLPVTLSSNVVSIGYDNATRQLFVVYKTGPYRYDAVPYNKWQGLLRAESKGKYLNAEIKPFYPFVKLDRIVTALERVVAEYITVVESGVIFRAPAQKGADGTRAKHSPQS